MARIFAMVVRMMRRRSVIGILVGLLVAVPLGGRVGVSVSEGLTATVAWQVSGGVAWNQMSLVLHNYQMAVLGALAALGGQGGISDLVQDLAGARALMNDTAAYLPVGEQAASLGLDWQVQHASTHPPTAFLFLLPLVSLPWSMALQLWALLMVLALGISAWAYGVPLRRLPLFLPLLLWPPALTSFGQLTPLWLLGGGLAWRFRDRTGLAGAFLAVAALTKGFPLIGLVPLMRRAAVRPAILGIAAIGLPALVVVVCLEPRALVDYMTIGREAAAINIKRSDNGALLPLSWALFQFAGLIVALALCGLIVAQGWRSREEAAEWARWAWLSVALLPIAWTYSLLPLLPWLLWDLRRPKFRTRLFAGFALLVPFAGAQLASEPLAIALAIILAGLATLTS